jgi:hypothetical protein
MFNYKDEKFTSISITTDLKSFKQCNQEQDDQNANPNQKTIFRIEVPNNFINN